MIGLAGSVWARVWWVAGSCVARVSGRSSVSGDGEGHWTDVCWPAGNNHVFSMCMWDKMKVMQKRSIAAIVCDC